MKKIILSLYFCCSVIWTNAQGIITGNITDYNSHEALPGAHVFLEGTSMGTVSDEFGNFSLKNVPHGTYDASVTFIGYSKFSEPVEIANGSVTSVSVRLAAGDLTLDDITITASSDQSINTLSPLDIKLRPTNTSQDILRMVPGLFIAQHAGGGKAEQIFLRGFDIDHGTDVSLEVDGLPVNMVSHAHGQGYSDLHFVIPELVNYVDFNKGPYYADKGDFTTAGYVDFQTKNILDKSFLKLEGGRFGTTRGVAAFNLPTSQDGKSNGYIASEFFRSNGFVESAQDFNRFNVMSKFSTDVGSNDKLTFGATFFTSRWDASGQIPERAVANGMITRYGSIDNTEGGKTSRANLYVKNIHEFANGAYFAQQVYIVSYDFNLFSNFTFFLNDPVHGDQIQQKESRMIYGYKANFSTSGLLLGKPLRNEAGIGFRLDDVNNIALSHTDKREFLDDVKRGDINESNVNVYLNEIMNFTDKLTLTAGLRYDYFTFSYSDKLTGLARANSKGIVSPKLNINYQLNPTTQLYVRSGFGFHSNDSRVVTDQSGTSILPRAFGVDVGMNSKVTEKLLAGLAIWRLDLQQEFVYVGDEGVVEPSGKTQREGIDLSIRYQMLPWLFADGDLNFTRPRSKDEAVGNNYIPLAPTFSTIGGISFRWKNGFNGSLRYRCLGDRAANADKSVIAKGYVLTDAIVNYTKPKFEIGLSAENIFNVDWNEAQFDTESRLKDETEPVSEIHFTPGTPFFLKLKLCFFF